MSNKPILAWHFLPEDKRLRYDDGRHIQVGKTYRVKNKNPIELCANGMHASVDILDAIRYAPGPILCKVEMGDDCILGDDKCVSSSRKVISMIDATNLLHEFACKCAERALKKAEVTDERCWKAIKVKRQWMKNLATDDELAAAWDAASDAASDAAWAAASDAASDAAWAAASDAAWAAASAAASAAAWAAASAAASAAAWDAAWDAGKKWQRQTLKRMLKKEGM